MRKHIKILLLLMIIPCALLAETSQEVVGARPSGMGGAFVGVADDGNALYWNPAGMAFLNHHEITSMYCDLFGLEIANNYLAYTYPVTGRFALGIDWFNLGYDDPELSYSFNKFNLGASYKVTSKASVGALLKFLNTSTDFDSRSIGKGNGWTADLGGLYRINEKLSAGVVLTNAFDGNITYDNGVKSQLYDMGIRVGIGYRPLDGLLVASDVSDRFHLGAEYWYRDLLALRSGLQRDLDRGKETVLSFGVGLKWSAFQFDYSYTHYPHLDKTSRISLSTFFDFGRSLVSVNDVKLTNAQGLFPALWNTYKDTPFLAFELENRTDEPLECSWQVDVEEMTDAPSTGRVILRPKETKELYSSAQFSDKFYSNAADAFRSGEVSITYSSGRESKSLSKKFQTFVYKKGAIDWNAGVERIGSFITAQDPELRAISALLVEENADFIDNNSMAGNIHYAMAIFNGLKAYGLKYLPDPNNPFAGVRGKEGVIDDIQYPIELLNSKRGDCDDLTALFCALLESIGIETVIIDVPGHIYLMFDSGVPVAYRMALMVDDDLLVMHGSSMFIPLEITALESSFIEAWLAGASAYGRWVRMSELRAVDVREAWSAYPPVPTTQKIVAAELPPEISSSGMQSDLTALAEMNDLFLNIHYLDGIQSLSADPSVLNKTAVALAFEGRFDESESLLRQALSVGEKRVDVQTNLANVLSVQGKHREALGMYEQMDSAWIASECSSNLVSAKCLSVDIFGIGTEVALQTFIQGLCSRYGAATGLCEVEDFVAGCVVGSQSGLELASCVALQLEERRTSVEKGSEEGALDIDKINEFVRLFQWYY